METVESVSEILSRVNWDFPNSKKGETVHSIHPYPAKFIPEIPRTLIKTLGVPTGTAILDTFCGSGVTLVEAQNASCASIGIDLNPIACLISRVKTRALDANLASSARIIVQNIRDRVDTPPIPLIPNLDHWFTLPVQRAVANLIREINSIQISNSGREALNLALSSILVRVSNQESDTRYAAIDKGTSYEETLSQFIAASDRIAGAINAPLFPVPDSLVLNKDILEVTAKDIPKPIGLVITSPPYPNAYEYWLYHKYRMFWLGYDPINVKKKEIGARAHYFSGKPPTEEDFARQMRHLFQLFFQVVIPGGYACVVIGRSKIHGKIIDNAALIERVAKSVGFQTISTIERQIATSRKSFNLSHAKINREHILVFQR